MILEVFSRYEKKYILAEEKYKYLLYEISKKMVPDAYCETDNTYSIHNLYYDTEDDQLIRQSLEGPVYKEKLRLRGYGKIMDDQVVFLEIKKKYKGVVYKRRTSLFLEEAYAYMETGKWPDNLQLNRQVMSEIDYMRRIYCLLPKVLLSYDRQAFFDKENPNFRLTFDFRIRAKRTSLKLEEENNGNILLSDNFVLMEVKIPQVMPLWFSKILSDLNVFPTSFSKYGTEYRYNLLNNRNEGSDKGCLIPSLPQQELHYNYQPIHLY